MHSSTQASTDAPRPALHPEPFVDLEAASAFLGVKPTWTYEAVRLGRIPSYKVGKFRRFRISELAAWAENHHEGKP
jgi:excisionase family DNA binding protein